MEESKDSYKNMWEEFGQKKSEGYFTYKFKPTHRIGLTNFVREEEIFYFLDPQGGDIVLDAGCASGKQLFEIQSKIKEGYGTDIAQSFINSANERKNKLGSSNLFFQRAEVENLPFENNFFDKVICAEVLEHVFNKEDSLRELKRVTKIEGYIIVSVPNMNADATWWGRLLRMFKLRSFDPIQTFTNDEMASHGDGHVREYTRDTLTNWFTSEGLKVIDIRSASFIDGPFFDFLLKFPLHVEFSRNFIIGLERFLAKRHWYWGRHLIIKVQK